MSQKYIQNLLAGILDAYVEDFSAKDIQIDQWNGRIAKDNVKLRPTALDWVWRSLFGAPCQIVQGYIKKIIVDVPWTQIFTKPVEIRIEEIHIILKSSESYDREFMKQNILAQKREKVDQIIAEIKKQMDGQVQAAAEESSYLGKLGKAIYENLRINVRNIHIRFEDTKVSRSDQAFNFGLLAESISYSMTNNRFQKAFLNIDDKLQEQKSFSLLLVSKFAMYWNSNAQDNWTKNQRFIGSNATATMEFSKSHVENLMRKHYKEKQEDYSSNLNSQSVFLVQPCNLSFKFRTNLAPKDRPEIPIATTVMENSEINVTVDEEIYKDSQYLTKFFAWHSSSVSKKKSYLKFRPAYNCQVIGNAREYWKYAINTVIYQIRKEKQKQSPQHQEKRQREMIQLTECFKMEQFNKHCKDNSLTDRLLEEKHTGRFVDEAALHQRREKLEYKLDPQQIVVAKMQADKEAQTLIEQKKSSSSWGSWMPSTSMFTTSFWTSSATGQQPKQEDGIDSRLQKQLDAVQDKMSKVDESLADQDQQTNQKQVTSCFMVLVPQLQIMVVNKLDSGYEPKCFLGFTTQDLYLQCLTMKDGSQDFLFSIKSFEIADKLVQSPKFQRVFYKTPGQRTTQTPAGTNSQHSIQKYMMKQVQSQLSEIEEESNPNVNNGLPLVKTFAEITKHQAECADLFVLAQLQITPLKTSSLYKLDLLISQTSMFYNRALAARIQTFLHQATMNRVQNAAAEADFDEKYQSIKQETSQRVEKLVDESVFEVACTLKGLEVLVPDDSNFEEARYLMLQTGSISLRSRQPHEHFAHKLDKLMVGHCDPEVLKLLQEEVPRIKQREQFAFNIFQIQVQYFSQISQLEQVLWNIGSETQQSQEEIERLYSILRRNDLQVNITKVLLKDDKDEPSNDVDEEECKDQKPDSPASKQLIWIDAHVANLDIRTSNKELKELKQYSDRVQNQHREYAELVERELQHMIGEQVKFEAHLREILKSEDKAKKQNSQYQQQYSQQNVVDIFKSCRDVAPKSDASDSDEFFDAKDHFDAEIMDKVQRAEIQTAIDTVSKTSHSQHEMIFQSSDSEVVRKAIQAREAPKNEQASNLMLVVQVGFGKLKIQVLESTIYAQTQQQVPTGDQFVRGVPFLAFEMLRTSVTLINDQSNLISSVLMKEFSLQNIEKQSAPQVIIRSGNVDTIDVRVARKESMEQQSAGSDILFDLEEEDNINDGLIDDHDIDEYFTKVFVDVNKSQQDYKVVASFGLTELEIAEFSTRKLIDNFASDWTATPQQSQAQQFNLDSSGIMTPTQLSQLHDEPPLPTLQEKQISVLCDWKGLIARMRVKKDISTVKVLGLQSSFSKDESQQVTRASLEISDFQIHHQEEEIVFKYYHDQIESRILLVSYNESVVEPTETQFNQMPKKNKTLNILLTNMLAIVETASILAICQNAVTLSKIIQPYLIAKPKLAKHSRRDSNDETYKLVNQSLNQSMQSIGASESRRFQDSCLCLDVIVSGCHLQVPSASESKNSLFIEVDNLNLKQSERGLLQLKFQKFFTFVAKHIDQENKYPLLQVQNISMTQDGMKTLLLQVDIEEVKATLNENYVLFFASIAEYHLEHALQFMTFLQKQGDPKRMKDLAHSLSSISGLNKKPYISLNKAEQLAEKSILVLIILNNILEQGNSYSQTPIGSYLRVSVEEVTCEWVLGMTFDVHDSDFVTLRDRESTKKILDELNKKLGGEEALPSLQKSSSIPRSPTKSKKQLQYDKLVFKSEKIQLERVKSQEIEQIKLTVAQVSLENHLVQNNSSQNILLVKPLAPKKAQDGQPYSQEAITLLQHNKDFELKLTTVDLRICKANVQTIAQIVKQGYSCKNAMRGTKRSQIRKFLSQRRKQVIAPVNEQLDSNSESNANLEFPELKQAIFIAHVTKVRVVVFEGYTASMHSDNKLNLMRSISSPQRGKQPGQIHLDQLQQNACQDFLEDQHHFPQRTVFVLEFGVAFSNDKPLNQEIPEEDMVDDLVHSADQNFYLAVDGLQVYLNQTQTSLAELFSSQSRLNILYPMCVSLENKFYARNNFHQIDIDVSMIEAEMSFKQIFFLMLLAQKIEEASKPIIQVAESMQRGKPPQQEESKSVNRKQESKIIDIKTSSIYFALIKEQSSNFPNQKSCGTIPMLSLELKHLEIQQKKQPTGFQETKIKFPFELYYFNQKLSFFEPAIERTYLCLTLQSGLPNQKTLHLLEVKDQGVLNLNFSVALYENLFLLFENFNTEFAEYNRIVEIQNRENVMGQSQSMNQSGLGLNLNDEMQNQMLFSHSSYFIKNKTGEQLLFMAGKKPAYTDLSPNQELPLEFYRAPEPPEAEEQPIAMNENIVSDQELFEGVDIQPHSDAPGTPHSHQSSQGDSASSSEDDCSNSSVQPARNQDLSKPRSPYRRNQFKFKKSEPNRVWLQVTIQKGKQTIHMNQFDINFDLLTCQRYYLDDQRLLYVICQTQVKDGHKYLIVRSPMQVTNNLQIPIEVQLLASAFKQQAKCFETTEEDSQQQVQARENKKSSGLKKGFNKMMMNKQKNDFNMYVKPGASQIIPLKACNFDSVQIRPINPEMRHSSLQKQDSQQYEWCSRAPIKLLAADEVTIFEQQPIVCHSRITSKNRVSQDRNNNQVFFVLNSNTYSIRSFIDFNTQQTEFFSLRYLSVTAPFTIQNLVPVGLTMMFKGITKTNEREQNPPRQKSLFGNQIYDLPLKHNSSLQVLHLDPLGNFDFSIATPGFQPSNYMPFKLEQEDDFKLSNDIMNKNYIDAGFMPQEIEKAGETELLQEKAQWRFVRQKKLLLQLCSMWQNQFNICLNVSFVQGFYHLSFYSKYWFLNNTQMPLLAQVRNETFSFPTLDLPFQAKDFDFDTVKHFSASEGKGALQSQESGQSKSIQESHQIVETESMGSNNEKGTLMNMSHEEESKSGKMSAGKYMPTLHNMQHQAFMDPQILNNGGSFIIRQKPWEAHKSHHSTVQNGVIACLDQEDIDRVNHIYFTHEHFEDENDSVINLGIPSHRDSQAQVPQNTVPPTTELIDTNTAHKTFKNPSIGGASSIKKTVKFDENAKAQQTTKHLLGEDLKSKLSRTSLQVSNYTQQFNKQNTLPLNQTALAKFDLFQAPLQDQQQLKRIILFSDVPIDLEQTASNHSGKDSHELKLKICSSEWQSIQFDIQKLQQDPIRIKDLQRQEGHPQALYEIVAVVTYLPQPFSFSKLICFQPRYLMVNRTHQLITVVQAQCEELGSFKIFAQETSVFHWTDAQKPLEICVKVDEHEYSGNCKLDNIGEINLRLKAQAGQAGLTRENMILNVTISEETNSFYIVFSDLSYAPPYRLENLTKTRFKIQQSQSRPQDFDILEAFTQQSFAWSYPLREKLLRISLLTLQGEQHLGDFDIDKIHKKQTTFKLRDKQRKRDFLLEISNEKTIKVVKIVYEKMIKEGSHTGLEGDQLANQHSEGQGSITVQKIAISRLGLSIVNSQARELCYVSFSNLRLRYEQTQKHQKMSFKLGDLQIDNQLSRANSAIILKRESRQTNQEYFSLKFLYQHNQAIENLLYFKYLWISVVPFELVLDGNFCDESYKYVIDVFQLANKFTRAGLGSAPLGEHLLIDSERDPTAIKQPTSAHGASGVETDVEQIKSAINELKKKGQPYLETSRDLQKIYIEDFKIAEVKLSFSFQSSPIMFREFTMNPTLKFLIVLFSNLKNVKLHFNALHVSNQHLLLGIFLQELKRFYVLEFTKHQQLLKIVTSMGIFGNISGAFSDIKHSVRQFLMIPFDAHHENKVKALMLGSIVLMRDGVKVAANSVQSIFESMKRGTQFIVQYSLNKAENDEVLNDKDLFENDLESVQRAGHFSTPLTAIDTQNRIWLKIITREKQNYDVKMRLMRKQKEPSATIHPNAQQEHTQRQRPEAVSLSQRLYSYLAFGSKTITYIPLKLFKSSAGVLNVLLDEDDQTAQKKVRPPRFVSFTMELEPYSKKKAFALERLNDINLNVIEAETIIKLYEMSQTVVIITRKRIICVEELNKQSSASDQVFNQSSGDIPASEEQLEQFQSGGKMYRHWNVFFKDIIRIDMEIIEKTKNVSDNPSMAAGTGTAEDHQKYIIDQPMAQAHQLGQINKNNVFFKLFVHYMINKESKSGAQIGKASPLGDSSDIKMGLAAGNSASANNLGGLSGFRVNSHEIRAKAKDYRTVSKVHRCLEQRMMN